MIASIDEANQDRPAGERVSIRRACALLEVSPAGYYAWRDRGPSDREAARWEHVPTGIRYAEAWEAADLDTRRDLFAAELKVVVCRETVDAPAWFDPDRDTEFTVRACRVYAPWNPHRL